VLKIFPFQFSIRNNWQTLKCSHFSYNLSFYRFRSAHFSVFVLKSDRFNAQTPFCCSNSIRFNFSFRNCAKNRTAIIFNLFAFQFSNPITALFSQYLSYFKTQIVDFRPEIRYVLQRFFIRFVRLENRRFFGCSKSLVKCLSVRYLV